MQLTHFGARLLYYIQHAFTRRMHFRREKKCKNMIQTRSDAMFDET